MRVTDLKLQQMINDAIAYDSPRRGQHHGWWLKLALDLRDERIENARLRARWKAPEGELR